MTKKNFIIQLLQKLESEWPLVDGFLIMLQNESCSDKDIENIFSAIKDQIDTLHDNELKQKTKKVFQYIEIMHKKENQEKINEEQDIDLLLTTINSL